MSFIPFIDKSLTDLRLDTLEARVLELERQLQTSAPGQVFAYTDPTTTAETSYSFDPCADAAPNPDEIVDQDDPGIPRTRSGGVTLQGVMSMGPCGGIYVGTGSFATPSTGTKIFAERVSNTLRGVIAGYNAGVEQWRADTDGKIKAGGGEVLLDATGTSVREGSAQAGVNSYKFTDAAGATVGGYYQYLGGGVRTVVIEANASTGATNIRLEPESVAGATATITLGAITSTDSTQFAALYVRHRDSPALANVEMQWGNGASTPVRFSLDLTTGQLTLGTTGIAAGLVIGTTTQLYESATNVLRTPDGFTVDGTLTVGGIAVNLGVGTTVPQQPLHVEAVSAIVRLADSNSTSTSNCVGFVEIYDRNNTARAGWMGYGTADGNLQIRNEVAAGTIGIYTNDTERLRFTSDGGVGLIDGITAPATVVGLALLYVDSADGDLKVKFGDGVVKTIVIDT